jgi:hypothetical protein
VYLDGRVDAPGGGGLGSRAIGIGSFGVVEVVRAMRGGEVLGRPTGRCCSRFGRTTI